MTTKTTALTDKARKQRMTPAERSATQPKNAKLAIAAFCYRCQDDARGPHLTRAAVRDCANTACELWGLRPWQKITTRSQAPSTK